MSDVLDRPRAVTPAALPFAIPPNRWSEAEAASKSPAELLLYRSNLLGSDLTVTNFGGGNTSAKLQEKDPLARAAWRDRSDRRVSRERLPREEGARAPRACAGHRNRLTTD
jgi:hypothetical protein